MSYIGNAPASFFTAVTSDVFSANGTANTFTLSKSISNLADIEVVVDNIQQNPFSGSYSVSGSSLTFSSTPSAGSNNIIVTYRQATIGSSIPTPNTVSNSSLQSNLLLTGNTSLGNTTITGTANVSGQATVNTLVVSTNTVTIGTGSYFVANGNVGIGTAIPAYKLEVTGGTAGAGQQSLANFRTADSTTSYNAGFLIFATPSTTASSRSVYALWDADGANASGTDYFYINKIGNSGNVELRQSSNASMLFYTNDIERMRISSNGTILVNTTFNGDPSRLFNVTGQIASTFSDANDIQLVIGTSSTVAFVSSSYGSTGSYKDLELRTSGQSRVIVDTAGRLLAPYQPAFRAQCTSGTINAGNTIVFNNETTDIGGNYNTSNGRFTAPVAGMYQFNFAGISTFGNTDTSVAFYLNGVSTGIASYMQGVTNYKNLSMSVALYLSANDYITVYVTGGAIYASGDNGNPRFSGFLIG